MVRLYNVKHWGSMPVQLLLEELELTYENVWLTKDQVHAPEFSQKSPLGLIPVLEVADGRCLFESAAIMVWVAGLAGARQMAPAPGTPEYGTFLSWLSLMASEIYPLTRITWDHVGQEAGVDSAGCERLKSWANTRQHHLFGIINAHLKEDGPMMMGVEFSALDLYVFTLATWLQPSETVGLADFPEIREVCKMVRARPRLKSALEVHGVLNLVD